MIASGSEIFERMSMASTVFKLLPIAQWYSNDYEWLKVILIDRHWLKFIQMIVKGVT